MSDRNTFQVVLFSFGFKYDAPTDANIVWDVRFLPNPYWVESLRPKTGREGDVSNYVIRSAEGKAFLSNFLPCLEQTIEQYLASKKTGMHVGIGCTGGRHRSVAVVEYLAKKLPRNINIKVSHRDIERDITSS